MDLAIKLIVFLPLVAAAIAGLFCRVIGARPAQIVTCAALLLLLSAVTVSALPLRFRVPLPARVTVEESAI